jgi:translocator protein
MILRVLIFLLINFAALAAGSYFTSAGVSSDWYETLVKAPWTPAGWVFGFAWTSIMVLFSIYMACLWPELESKKSLIALYITQTFLNIAWNPTFFYYHYTFVALFVILGLTFVVGFFLFMYWPELKLKSLLILPYLVWLIIAMSLNAYALINN